MTVLFPFAECKDMDTECPYWASIGDCIYNPMWMLENCHLSCCCDGTEKVNSLGNDTECEYWAARGECSENPSWMGQNCDKTCRPEVCMVPTATTAAPGTTEGPTVEPGGSMLSVMLIYCVCILIHLFSSGILFAIDNYLWNNSIFKCLAWQLV